RVVDGRCAHRLPLEGGTGDPVGKGLGHSRSCLTGCCRAPSAGTRPSAIKSHSAHGYASPASARLAGARPGDVRARWHTGAMDPFIASLIGLVVGIVLGGLMGLLLAKA